MFVETVTSAIIFDETAVAVVITTLLAVLFAVLLTGSVTSAGVTALVVVGAGAGAGLFISMFAVIGADAVTVALTATGALSSSYIVWRVIKKDQRFNIVQVFWGAATILGGTSFCGADLTSTIFSQACLSHTSFADSRQKKTNVTHVYWQGVKEINSARLGSSILQDVRVRSVLIASEQGYKQNLSYANFRGANLSGATLEKSILKYAILSDALLRGTVLKDAILTEAQAVNADFTCACLTGATLESWNIDSTTILKNIDCDYVYLLEQPKENDDRERRPHDITKMFQPGDFEKLFQEVQDDVQLLIRNGANPIALRAAFQKIRENYPDLPEDAFQGFQRRDEDFLVTVKVPQSIDKGQFQRDWDTGYQAGLQAGREESAALLASAEKRADGLEAIALTMAQNPLSIQDSQIVTTNDYSQTIEVKGNVDSSVIGQGDRNQLTNTNQPDPSPDSAQ